MKLFSQLFVQTNNFPLLYIIFNVGLTFGFLINNLFKIDFGGGISFNEFFYPGGYGYLGLSFIIQ